MNEIYHLFPNNMRQQVQHIFRTEKENVEEIRLRMNQQVEIILQTKNVWLKELVTGALLDHILAQMTNHSLYRYEEDLRQGFLTMAGGHRVGLAGRVSIKEGHIYQLSNISFMNIRISRKIKLLPNPLLSYLHNGKQWFNTCIVGPPQSGKTSLLRALAKSISDGALGICHQKLLVIDERSEIAGLHANGTAYDLGKRTDVLDGCPKHIGFMLGIRSLSPQVIMVDEIGSQLDIEKLQEAIYSGVHVISTIHAHHIADLTQKLGMKTCLADKVFDRFVELRRMNYSLQVKILNADLQTIGNEWIHMK